MDIILALIWLIQYVFVAPVWWLAKTLASFFIPYEGDENHFFVSLFFAMLVVAGVLSGLVFWIKE